MNAAELLTSFVRSNPSFEDIIQSDKNKPAAVLVAITNDEQPKIWLTQRPKHLKDHPAQICFPGGKVDISDVNNIDTAYREANEEIGVQPQQLELIGTLPIFTTYSGFNIQPVIAYIQNDFQPNVNKEEVDDCFTIPVQHILNETNFIQIKQEKTGKKEPVYFLPYRQKMIWGATAAILYQLSQMIRTHQKPA